MRVTWWADYSPDPDSCGNPDDWRPVLVKEHGEIIGTVNSFWSGLLLVIARNDGQIVKIPADRCKVKKK